MSRLPLKSETVAVLRLGGPLIAFFLIQNFASLAALAFVGRLGDASLAGLGAAGAIFGVVLALMFGFDAAVQALVSRATGAGEPERVGQILIEAWSVTAPLGALLATGLWFCAPALASGILHDPAAVAAGAANLRGIAASLVFLALSVPVNAVWIGKGRPGLAFLVTALTVPVQIALTALLVIGAGPIPAGGAGGAGAAYSLSCLFGAALQLALALRFGIVAGWSGPRLPGVLRIVDIGWPVSLQQSLAQVGVMAAYIIVAQLGTASAAIISVLVNLTTLTINAAVGFGVAAATLVGQALGRGQADEARSWGWRATRISVLTTAPLGLIAALAPQPLLGLFLHDPATLDLAVWPLRSLGLAVAAASISNTLSFAFRGAGATKIAAGIPFATQSLILLPLMWWIGVRLSFGVTGIVAMQAALTVAEAIALAWLWRGSFWVPDLDPPMAVNGARRIAILGGAGSGKSTLARRLGEQLGLPAIHLDRLVFGPGWSRRPAAEFTAALAGEITGDAWIVEGTYAEASALTLPRADLVVWLDQPAWLRLWRSWRKTRVHRGRPRADRPDGCEEGFGWPYAVSILSFGAWSPELGRQIATASGRPALRLRGDRDIERLAAALGAAYPAAPSASFTTSRHQAASAL